MQENMLLIKEINMQRGHNKAAKRVLEAQVTAINIIVSGCYFSMIIVVKPVRRSTKSVALFCCSSLCCAS